MERYAVVSFDCYLSASIECIATIDNIDNTKKKYSAVRIKNTVSKMGVKQSYICDARVDPESQARRSASI